MRAMVLERIRVLLVIGGDSKLKRVDHLSPHSHLHKPPPDEEVVRYVHHLFCVVLPTACPHEELLTITSPRIPSLPALSRRVYCCSIQDVSEEHDLWI